MNGLVLEGGGARGSYHVGAIKAFKKRHIKFDYVVGTSIGSINGVFVVSGQHKKLERLWKSADSQTIFGIDKNIFDVIKKGNANRDIIKKGIKSIFKIIYSFGIDTTPLKTLLIKHIDEEKFIKSKINFGLATYNISKLKPISIFKKDIPKGKLVEYLIASSYLPIFRFEKIIDKNYYLDGGLFNACPVDMLIDKNLDNIYVVRCHSYKLSNFGTKSKIIEIKAYNRLSSIVVFDKSITKYNIKLGYYDTLRKIDNLDGKKYYFKYKSEKYYDKLLKNKKVIKKYNSNRLLFNNKKIVINIFEEICERFNVKRFKIYNIRLLIVKLKIKNLLKKDEKYSIFINELRLI